jgi:drug/metabolite transporter (DMT)-like permease
MAYYSGLVERSTTKNNIGVWLGATLLAQTAWGAYPVVARYLQTVSRLPSMSLIALGTSIALVVVLVLFHARVQWRGMLSRRMLVFAAIVVGRGIANFLAARFTLAIYVQLITMLTPFIVALLSTAVLHEALPRYTGRALGLSMAGVWLIIGSDLLGAQQMPMENRSDWLGIGLALVGSLLLALYMLDVRRSTQKKVSAEELLVVQLTALAASGWVLSLLLGESWAPWLQVSGFDWFVFGLAAFGVLVGANIGQIGAIRHLGASLVSSTMPWRLVSALLVGGLLLGERLTSIWQWIGVALVLVTITWYLWQQRA